MTGLPFTELSPFIDPRFLSSATLSRGSLAKPVLQTGIFF
jgi:hypothetical protein